MFESLVSHTLDINDVSFINFVRFDGILNYPHNSRNNIFNVIQCNSNLSLRFEK